MNHKEPDIAAILKRYSQALEGLDSVEAAAGYMTGASMVDPEIPFGHLTTRQCFAAWMREIGAARGVKAAASE